MRQQHSPKASSRGLPLGGGTAARSVLSRRTRPSLDGLFFSRKLPARFGSGSRHPLCGRCPSSRGATVFRWSCGEAGAVFLELDRLGLVQDQALLREPCRAVRLLTVRDGSSCDNSSGRWPPSLGWVSSRFTVARELTGNRGWGRVLRLGAFLRSPCSGEVHGLGVFFGKETLLPGIPFFLGRTSLRLSGIHPISPRRSCDPQGRGKCRGSPRMGGATDRLGVGSRLGVLASTCAWRRAFRLGATLRPPGKREASREPTDGRSERLPCFGKIQTDLGLLCSCLASEWSSDEEARRLSLTILFGGLSFVLDRLSLVSNRGEDSSRLKPVFRWASFGKVLHCPRRS